MPAGFTRPDLYVSESLLATAAPVNTTTAAAALVAAAPRGPVTPVKCQSWSDAQRHFGNFSGVAAQDVLRQAFFDAFNNGARTVYGVRVAGTGAATAMLGFSVTASDGAVVAAAGVELFAKNPGVWGNNLYVEVADGTAVDRKNITVRDVPTGAAITNQQIVERWNDVSLDPADQRYLLSLLNAAQGGSAYLTARLRTTATAYTYTAGDKLTNTAAGGAKLASGADGAAVTGAVLRDAVYTLDVIPEPLVLNCPGTTDATTVGYLADYADFTRTRSDGEPGRGDVFVVVDCDPSVDEAGAVSKAATFPKSDFLAAYYPQLVVNDPSNAARGSTKLVPPGPSILGRFMATDASRGVFKAAANMDGLLTGVVALDPAAKLRNRDLDVLHAGNVNAIKPIPGRGPAIIFGARTLKSDYVTRYVSARRTLIQVRADLRQALAFVPFENNDTFLWADMFSAADRVLRELHAARGLKGESAAAAYFITCDSTNNTTSTVEQGQVNIQVGLALQRPAEFVVLNISQFDGGAATVDEALAA